MLKSLLPVAACVAIGANIPAALAQPAQDSGDRAGRAQLTAFLSDTLTLAGDFRQRQRDDLGNVIDESAGRFYLQRPGKFFWDYTVPFVQQVISDGEQIWHYDADLAQVNVRPLSATLSATPAVLLTGGEIGDDVTVTQLPPSEDGLTRIQLQPNGEASEFERAVLAFDDSIPARIEIADALGGMTTIEFSDVLSNRALRPELFRFEPPPGVEVVDAAAF